MPGNVVAPLHQIAAVLDRDDRRDGVRGAQWKVVGEKIRGQHDTFGSETISRGNGFRP